MKIFSAIATYQDWGFLSVNHILFQWKVDKAITSDTEGELTPR